MFPTKEMPSVSSLFSAYASTMASIMLFRSMVNELIPYPLRNYVLSTFPLLFKSRSSLLTLIIEESSGISRNQAYDAASIYLPTKITPDTQRLKLNKTQNDKSSKTGLESGEKLIDSFEGIELKWRFICLEPEKNGRNDEFSAERSVKRFFELSFPKQHREKILSSYIPSILERAEILRDENRVLKMHTLNHQYSYGGLTWDSVNLDHPATFETIAMEPELKNEVIKDLNMFVKRKEYYKKVGRAWKRGYLLYGPPGTGKSSLVAAIANYLKFDLYDLQLGNVMRDSDLRKLLLSTGNRSILVIEDIDCSVELPDRRHNNSDDRKHHADLQLTLSGLLNFIDGLWSSCGDERIIIFTTNHKDRLDPALLRPGRMDMHIHMSYCTPCGFHLLASNYLGINGRHRLFGEVENLLKETEVTPAEVAEELMHSEDADVALGGLVKLLKRKKLEDDENGDESGENGGVGEVMKKRKVGNKGKKLVGRNRRKCSGRRRNL